MTIDLSDNTPRASYSVAEGVSETIFAVPFEFFEDADVKVYVDDVLKASGSDYTLTGGSGATGTLTFVAPVTGAAGGSTVVIFRRIAVERTTDFPVGQDINKTALNEQLDTIVGMIADVHDSSDRTLRITDSEVNPGTTLPGIEERKGRVIAFDATTGAIEAGPLSNDIATIADNIVEILAVNDEAAAAAASATAAAVSSSEALVSQAAAADSEAAAATSEAAAAASESAAATSEANASTSATAAASSATAAAASEANAAASEAGVSASATSASSSATDAANSATAAAASETAAGVSETNAAASATAAATSATDAATSETNAATSEANAATSATSAATSATNAATSETNASASATAAASSATNASSSATSAATQASNAQDAADSALAALDNFDDRYLGPKASDPTTDNDGDPLVAGALYFNTTDDVVKVYEGASWVAAYASLAGALLTTGGTMTGPLTLASDPASSLQAATKQYVDTSLSGVSGTLGTLTKSFFEGESATITLSSSVSPTAIVGVTKEFSQAGISSKGSWNVSTTASNYEFYDQAPSTSISFAGEWSLSAVNYKQYFDVSSQGLSPEGVFFKPDGLKMFIVGSSSDAVHEYNLSTAWDTSTASYLQSFSVAGQESSPQAIFFKSDGTKMYIAANVSDAVLEYSLSTAWNISTASYSQSFSTASQETVPTGLFFKPDGLKMYVVGYSADTVYEYDLSTAWDVSTASFVQGFSVSTQDTSPTGVFFKTDGTKMYVVGGATAALYEYDLSTAWDVSTASLVQSFNFTGIFVQSAKSMFFDPDGLKLYVLSSFPTRSVVEYDISQRVVLGSGSFTSSDVGKRVTTGDGGEALIVSSDGYFNPLSSFSSETYSSGNWTLTGLDVDAANGISLSGISTYGDISKTSYDQRVSINTQETYPFGVFFKPDGLKMFTVGSSSDAVHEYDLSTAWSVSTASFVQSFSVSTQDTSPYDMFFRADGLKMYVAGTNGVHEYNLITAWDISTSSFVQTFSHTTITGLTFKSDGTKMYFVDAASSYDIVEYNLSTAWDVSTASLSQSFSTSGILSPNQLYGLQLSSDGLKMYTINNAFDYLLEFNLTSAWDISTSSYVQSYDFTVFTTSSHGFFFKEDLSNLYLVGRFPSVAYVYQFNVGEAAQPTNQYLPCITSASGRLNTEYWTDINSMTADDADNDGQVYYAVSADGRTTWSTAKASFGVRNIVRNNGGTWQYNSSTGLWSIVGAVYSQSFSVSSQESQPTDLFFKPDGTKVYVVGQGSDSVHEYDLSTAWDISTASYLQGFSVAAQGSSPQAVFFKPDGSKMYVMGYSSDSVHEYDLSTAWDISTASFVQSFSVQAQELSPTGLFFKSDGLKMYVVGATGDGIDEYNLSTAWDISTASFVQYFSLSSQDGSPAGVFFKPDGLKMYMIGYNSDTVYEYDLGTAWDISTISLLQSFNVSAQDTYPQGVTFKPDGSKMYVAGGSSDSILEYDVGVFTTSEAWSNATTNNEFSAVEDALSLEANQMDKAQLDAVTDAAHFTLGDTLDLAIIPYLASIGAAPTSDGVSINYDIAGLNKAAILGTDYDYDTPADDQVRITALADLNLKIRVV